MSSPSPPQSVNCVFEKTFITSSKVQQFIINVSGNPLWKAEVVYMFSINCSVFMNQTGSNLIKTKEA